MHLLDTHTYTPDHTNHFNIDRKDLFGVDVPHTMQVHPPTRHQQPSAICLRCRGHLWPLTFPTLPLTTRTCSSDGSPVRRAGVDLSDWCCLVAGKLGRKSIYELAIIEMKCLDTMINLTIVIRLFLSFVTGIFKQSLEMRQF